MAKDAGTTQAHRDGEDPELARHARSLYEEARRKVAGRPSWERLVPDCPYDRGMRATAFAKAADLREMMEGTGQPSL